MGNAKRFAPQLKFDHQRFRRDTERVVRNIDRLGQALIEETVRATGEELDRLLQIAKANTPVLTGRLRDSGRVFKQGLGARAESVNFQVAFGGVVVRSVLVDYAPIVHEQERFLENAAAIVVPGMPARVAKKTSQVVKKFRP